MAVPLAGSLPATPATTLKPPPPPKAAQRVLPGAVAQPVELSEAEAEAERALQRELEADAEARAELNAAMRRRDPSALRAAIAVMSERGLDCDDETIDAGRLMLAELEDGRTQTRRR